MLSLKKIKLRKGKGQEKKRNSSLFRKKKKPILRYILHKINSRNQNTTYEENSSGSG